MKKVFVETFGCQMNDDDSMRLLGFLGGLDYHRTAVLDEADLIVVNTCSVRDKAEQKVYSTLGRYKKLKEKERAPTIAVMGCVAQQMGERLLKRVSHLDLVIGTHNIHRVGELLKMVDSGGDGVVASEFSETIEEGEYPGFVEASGVSCSSVTIMRGCDNYCTYCIVPYVRGAEVSRPMGEILAEVASLAAAGVKDVTLLGQNVNSYGSVGGTGTGTEGDGGESDSFSDLLRKVCNTGGIERVRFVTSHPKDISRELIDLFEEEPKLVRNLHLPFQSGSNQVLQRMRRGYTIEDYMGKIDTLKALYPEMTFTTDVIVAFPGESAEDFEATMDVVRSVRFASIFSFKYSPRPGTAAASFAGTVDPDTAQGRLERLQEEQKTITASSNRAMAGRTVGVLVEGESRAASDELSGRTECNRVVNFPGDRASIGNIIDVVITDGFANSLRGVPAGRDLTC